jgi:uncharacterized membrane protein YciS (DUF1049 family)
MIFKFFAKKETNNLANVSKLNTSNEPKLTVKEKYILITVLFILLLVPISLTWFITKNIYLNKNISSVVIGKQIPNVAIEIEINNLIKSIEFEQFIISIKLDSLEKITSSNLESLSSELASIKKEERYTLLNKKINELDNEIKKSNVYVNKVEEIKKVNKEINTLLESYKLEINK